MEFLKLYCCYIRMFIKARMEYRFSFFAGMFANFYCYFITYITFWVIVRHFGSLGGWSFEEMTILYGLNLFTYSFSTVLYWYNVYHLEDMITTGRLDGFLIRPMGVLKQLVCSRFGDTSLGQIAVTLIFMIWALSSVSYQLTPLSYVYLAFAVVGGVLIQSGAMIMIGAMSFWTLRSGGIGDMLYYDLRTFVHYPLSIYPAFVRVALTFVLPWAFINYYPSLILLNRVETTGQFVLGMIAPLVGVAFFGLALFVFHKGLSRYSGSGS